MTGRAERDWACGVREMESQPGQACGGGTDKGNSNVIIP